MTYPGSTLYPASTVYPGSSAVASGTVLPGGLVVTLNGLLLTGTDTAGVQWFTFDPVDGWDSSVASSLATTQRAYAAGSWATTPGLPADRDITVTGLIVAPNAAAAQTAIDQLNAAITFGDGLLTVTRASFTRSAIVRRSDKPMWAPQTDTVYNWSVQLKATDPRKFATAQIAATGLPASSGGFTIPFTVPFTIRTTFASGQVQLTSAGNTVGPLLVRFDGPLVAPQVTHQQAGVTWACSLQLNAGDFLIVDMDAQQALAQGQVSRGAYITQRNWLPYLPGLNTLGFTAQSGTGQMTVTGTPAWL